MRVTPVAALVVVVLAGGCSRPSGSATTTSAGNEPIPPAPPTGEPSCHLVEEGFGPAGTAPVRKEIVASGLDVPWSIAFLPGGGGGDFLVTERPGRIRLVRGGALVPEPVATVRVNSEGESGLLGMVLHPRFAETRQLFLYYTASKGEQKVNRVARWVLDEAKPVPHAREERILLDDIPAASRHDGGRLRFGSDGMLYAATGDAAEPDLSQDRASTAGKILRLHPDGAAAPEKIVSGVRNVQAFDWLPDGRFAIADHGPSGERGRRGHDEISIARSGDNLGWPGTWGCERKAGVVTPLLVTRSAMPPGGATFYRGDAIPGWKNSFLVATLESKHLHRFVFDLAGRRVTQHEVYFPGDRLRDVVTGPDGAVYMTTSNCDGRGDCPANKDVVVRITSR